MIHIQKRCIIIKTVKKVKELVFDHNLGGFYRSDNFRFTTRISGTTGPFFTTAIVMLILRQRDTENEKHDAVDRLIDNSSLSGKLVQ